ncbi:RNA polymerase sigma factor [Actinoplanes sp. NBRC 101535]|uniref:RNA polymerase sigma factor n=1 Tax=Actinoplanes sp. NBRC 101535 TaxID=3032196 RepID=UPI0024A32DDB|nr:RNA polymerase sigma factor [Actinoplanes sp. NBRC 101535]GLY08193.1 RNA polymerase sigma factor [Actinoplanes sp. NBRC 101535]
MPPIAPAFRPEQAGRRDFTGDAAFAGRLWDLVAAHQAGDPAAFGELYSLTRPVITRHVRNRMLAYPREAVEDLVHDVYVCALGAIGTLTRATASPMAWLITITRNKVATFHRCNPARRELLVADYQRNEAPEDRPRALPRRARDTTDETAGQVLADDTARHAVVIARVALALLTDEQRNPIVMRHMQGLSIEETSRRLKTTTGAVKGLCLRGIQRLRRDGALAALATGAPWRSAA